MSSSIVFEGIDAETFAAVLESGVDQGGNPIEPFVDDDGGWPFAVLPDRLAAR